MEVIITPVEVLRMVVIRLIITAEAHRMEVAVNDYSE